MFFDGNALIANAIYIYLILVSGSVILASVALTIRGFVKRAKLDDTQSDENIHVLESEPVTAKRSKLRSKSISSDVNTAYKLANPLGSKTLLTRWKARSDAVVLDEEPPEEPEQEADSSATANERRHDTESPDPEVFRPQQPRTIYLLDTLMSLRVDVTQMPFQSNEIRLSVLLLPTVRLPPTRVLGKYAMDQELELVQKLIDDPLLPNRCMGLFRVVCAAAFLRPYSNIQHFHEGFRNFMVSLIDSLTLFSVTSALPTLQLSVLDLAFAFLWEHWNWEKGFQVAMAQKLARDTIVSAGATEGTVTVQEAVILEKLVTDKSLQTAAYEMLKINEADVVDEFTVFRLFCNLYLGTPIMAKPVRKRCVFKLCGIFYCCASRTKCNRHVQLAKILEKALTSTNRDSLKAFFYDILMRLLQPHLDCCIQPDDIFSNGSVIQKLIFQGLWTDQPAPVREKAADVVTVLSERFPEIISWNQSMKFTHLSDGKETGHQGAPGSWLIFK